MFILRSLVAACLIVAWAPAIGAGQESRGDARAGHRVLGSDQGKIAIVDERGRVEWEVKVHGTPHDLEMLPNGNVLFPTDPATIVEMTPDMEVVWRYTSKPKTGVRGPVEIHAFQRLDHGLTMIAETANRRIIEVSRRGRILREVPLKIDHPDPHRDTRMARKLDNGHYLVCHEADGAVREYDPEGHVVWSYALDLDGRPRTPGHQGHGTEVFGAIRLPSGNTLIATGNGNRVIEVNPEGEVVWKIDRDELPGIRLYWVTTLQLLPNGNIVVGNCHAGPENPQLFEITRDKEVVWTFKDFETFGNSMAASQVLDVEGEVIR